MVLSQVEHLQIILRWRASGRNTNCLLSMMPLKQKEKLTYDYGCTHQTKSFMLFFFRQDQIPQAFILNEVNINRLSIAWVQKTCRILMSLVTLREISFGLAFMPYILGTSTQMYLYR